MIHLNKPAKLIIWGLFPRMQSGTEDPCADGHGHSPGNGYRSHRCGRSGLRCHDARIADQFSA